MFSPHTEAIAAIAGKSIVTREVFAKLLPELQAAAFTVSGVECFDALQRIRDAIASIPAGANWDDVKADIEMELEPWLENANARQRRAELLLRIHAFRAYQATKYRLSEAHQDIFPYRQYDASGLDSMRPSHAALHGKIFPANSPFWLTHSGPWAWECKCGWVDLTHEEHAAIQAEDKAKNLPPEALRVVPSFIQDRIAQTGMIDVGPHEVGGVKKSQGVYDIRTDREKTGDPNAFEWRPGDVGMTLEQIKRRYDAPTWAQWEAWARKETIGPKNAQQTLWAAIGGATPAQPDAADNNAPSKNMTVDQFRELTAWIASETGLPEETAAEYAAEIGDTPEVTPEGEWIATVDGKTIQIRPLL